LLGHTGQWHFHTDPTALGAQWGGQRLISTMAVPEAAPFRAFMPGAGHLQPLLALILSPLHLSHLSHFMLQKITVGHRFIKAGSSLLLQSTF